jgi:hypothetical protein
MADIVLTNGMDATIKGYRIKFSGEVTLESPENGSREERAEFELSKYDIERLARLAGVIK